MGKFAALKKVLGSTWNDLPDAAKLGTKIGGGLAVSGAGASAIDLLNDELSGKNATQRAVLRKLAELGEKPEVVMEGIGKLRGLLE
jgi:hypothetical protein